MNDQGFIDLRLNRQEGQNNESFWPSFTDIMTVVVMIFLIAMVILMVRNLDLVRQLRATMEAEREAMELARATGEEKQSLSLRLNDTENELSRLRLKTLMLEEQKAALETRVSGLEQRLAALGKERDEKSALIGTLVAAKALQTKEIMDLRASLSGAEQRVKNAESQTLGLNAELASTRTLLNETQKNLENQKARDKLLETDLATARAALTGSEQQVDDLQLRQQSLATEVKTLRTQNEGQKQALEKARAEIYVTDKRLADLQGSFDDIKYKYDKLVKPARTASGKYVVEVRYFKQGGEYRIEYKEPDQTAYTGIGRQALEQRLAVLRDKDPDRLYIKIIFPDGSGLSYGEAWRFTSEIHKNYDYYYREATPR
ncbi:MAG: hypothetical protein KJ558_08135 [Gammaproteobacteria bacterium]|nr:hypothetical protein [Gammaproteobacteria bacterium]MBU1654781.1 hypothetical protein [Gammaproteobacteria bacterium]MBU1962654.1 hypothetical protein [Gammaproteobacteria bacterium]